MASSIVSGNAVVFTTSTGASTVTATPTWSLGSGSNLGVVLAFSHEQQAANRIASTITVGGVSFTKIIAGQYGTGTSYANSEIWACNEASAGSIGANPTISIAWANPSGTAANNLMAQGVIVTVQDCDQNLANWTLTDTDAQLATSALAGDLTGFTAGSLILGSYCDQTGGVSVNCAQTGGDSTTEFTSSDVNFNSSNARAVQFYASAADTTPAIRVQRNTTSGSVYQALAIVGVPDYVAPPSGPTISSVDSTPEHLATEALTGTGFPTSQTGSAAVKFVGVIETVTLTPTYDTATALSAAFDVGNNKFGVAGTVTVTDSSGNVSSGYAVTPQPRSGGAYVNLSTLAAAAFRLEATPDLQSGYQVEYYGGVGCTCGTDLILFDDATVQYPTGAVGFYARAHNGTSWGAPAFITISDLIAGRRGLVRPVARAAVRPVAWDTTN